MKFFRKIKHLYLRFLCWLNGHDLPYDLSNDYSVSQCRKCGKVDLDITKRKYDFIELLKQHDDNYL